MSTKPSMPAQPTTVEFEKPPSWAIALSEKVAQGFASVDARLGTVEQNVTILVDDKKTVNERLSRIETWKENEVTTRLNASSIRVQSVTEDTTKHDVAIANLTTKLVTIEEKTDAQTLILTEILNGGKALFKDPKFLALVAAAYTFAMWWLGKHGGGQ